MRKLLVLLLIGMFVSCNQKPTLTNPSIITPTPTNIIHQSGYFTFLNTTGIYITDTFQNKAAKNLIDVFLRSSNFRYTMLEGESLTGVNFINKGKFKEGGYKLIISSQKIEVISNNEAGAFNAVQTLIQLLSADIHQVDSGITEWNVPCVVILDQPKNNNRFVRLGNQYSFIDSKNMKKIINQLALHKINGLEIEMVDQHGWKLFFKNLPFRLNRNTYYSKQDYIELKKYAADRNVQLIPIINLSHEIAMLTLENLKCKPILIKGNRINQIKNECEYFFPLNKSIITEAKHSESTKTVCPGFSEKYQENKVRVDLLIDQILEKHQITKQTSQGLIINSRKIYNEDYVKKIATQLW